MSFVIELIIREPVGNHLVKIDHYKKISADRAKQILELKYSVKKKQLSFFQRLELVGDITIRELEKWAEHIEEKIKKQKLSIVQQKDATKKQ